MKQTHRTMRIVITTHFLTNTAWFCMLYFFIALCVLLGTFDALDFYGRPEWRPPYQWMVESVVCIGLIAALVGFCCGLWVLLFRKDCKEYFGYALMPTVVLGLFLFAIVILQCQMYRQDQRMYREDFQPPMVELKE